MEPNASQLPSDPPGAEARIAGEVPGGGPVEAPATPMSEAPAPLVSEPPPASPAGHPAGGEGPESTPLRLPSGVPGLDALLGGGLPARAALLVEGAPGGGKSSLGIQFLIAGASAKEPGVYFAPERHPADLREELARWPAWGPLERAGLLRVVHTPLQALHAASLHDANFVTAAVDELGARRIFLDDLHGGVAGTGTGGATDSGGHAPGEAGSEAFRALFMHLLGALKERGVASVFAGEPATFAMRHLADAVLELALESARGGWRRSLVIRKCRWASPSGPHRHVLVPGEGLKVYEATRSEPHRVEAGKGEPAQASRGDGAARDEATRGGEGARGELPAASEPRKHRKGPGLNTRPPRTPGPATSKPPSRAERREATAAGKPFPRPGREGLPASDPAAGLAQGPRYGRTAPPGGAPPASPRSFTPSPGAPKVFRRAPGQGGPGQPGGHGGPKAGPGGSNSGPGASDARPSSP